MNDRDFSKINREVQRRMEIGNTHHTLEAERQAEQILLIPKEELLRYLDGDILKSSADWAASNLGDQRIRAIKNGLITLITQVCRASIKYGLDAEFAYTLSDYYIGYLETLGSQEKLMELMKDILLHYNTLVRDSRSPKYSRNVNRGIEYISMNLYMPVKAKEVAAHVGMEPHYYSELFKKETGMSPYEYILKKKLETARESLENTRSSITYIATSLGFCDASHFEKRFKEEFGVTPSAYRNARKPDTVFAFEKDAAAR